MNPSVSDADGSMYRQRLGNQRKFLEEDELAAKRFLSSRIFYTWMMRPYLNKSATKKSFADHDINKATHEANKATNEANEATKKSFADLYIRSLKRSPLKTLYLNVRSFKRSSPLSLMNRMVMKTLINNMARNKNDLSTQLSHGFDRNEANHLSGEIGDSWLRHMFYFRYI